MSQVDSEYIEKTLQDIKEHFKEWVNSYSPNPLDLCQFAYYEQCGKSKCCSELLERGSPIALGDELVSKGYCEWIVVNGDLALEHRVLGNLTFADIATGDWFSDDDQPAECWPELIKAMTPGEIIANSFERLAFN